MKIATVLFFTALVCVAQAQFPSFGIGNVVQSTRDRLQQLRKTIDEQLQQAEERLQNAYHQARERAQDAYKRLQDAAEDVRNRVTSAVDNVQQNIENQVNQMAASAESQGVDVSDCKALVQSFRNAADAVVGDSVSCITDKVQRGKDITTNVLDLGQEGLDVITGIRSEANKCVENANSITEQMGAVACLVRVEAKAAWALATKVPALARSFAEATVLISTLQPSVAYCMSKNSILALTDKGTLVVADVRKCISQRVAAAQGTNKPEVPEVTTPALPEVPEVTTPALPQVPEVTTPELPGIPEVTTPELPIPEVPATVPEMVLPGFEEAPAPLGQA